MANTIGWCLTTTTFASVRSRRANDVSVESNRGSVFPTSAAGKQNPGCAWGRSNRFLLRELHAAAVVLPQQDQIGAVKEVRRHFTQLLPEFSIQRGRRTGH